MTENSKLVLIDIGSTIIKICFCFNDRKEISNIERKNNQPLYKQVEGIIEQIKLKHSSPKIRICSSANGGLKVGLISLTTRYSGEITKRMILNSGSNLKWEVLEIDKSTDLDEVDLVVISGGLNIGSSSSHKNWLAYNLSKLPNQIPLIYCGNKYYHGLVVNEKPDAIIIENIFLNNMKFNSERLINKIRDMYLLDLIHKEGVSKLQKYSEIPIFPTPLICKKSFEELLKNNREINLNSPTLMIDIGGATTDVYYGRELIKNLRKLNVEALPINRYVFSSIGVVSSKKSTIAKSQSLHNLYDILDVIVSKNTKKKYIDFREKNTEWLVEEDLFYLCFANVLNSLIKGDESKHPISLEKIKTIIITGGGSQICNSKKLKKILDLYVSKEYNDSVKIHLDHNYEIWTLGLSTLKNINDENRFDYK